VRPKEENLAACDDLLLRAESLERDIHALIRDLPPGVATTADFLAKTANTAHVIVEKLNTAYNLIRRYDHA
jgi:aspartate/glutamate racemase